MKNKTLHSIFVLTLFLIHFSARAEIVVIVNPKNATTHMTLEQISQIFLGKSNALMPVDLSENSAIRAEFYKKALDKNLGQVKAIWSKLVFTGKGTLPKEYASSAEVKSAVAADINVIAYIDKSDVDASVKVISAIP